MTRKTAKLRFLTILLTVSLIFPTAALAVSDMEVYAAENTKSGNLTITCSGDYATDKANVFCYAPTVTVKGDNDIESVTVGGTEVELALPAKEVSFVLPLTGGKEIYDGYSEYTVNVYDIQGNEASQIIGVGHTLGWIKRIYHETSCATSHHYEQENYCKYCGELFAIWTLSSPIPEGKGHTFGDPVVHHSGCGDFTTQTCEVCGFVQTDYGTSVHNWSSEYTVKEATCTENGVKYKTCTNEGCDAVNDVQIIPDKGHNYSNFKNVREATCTQSGLRIGECANGCGKHEEILTGTLAHCWEYTVTKAPSCTETGLKTARCKVCGTEYPDGPITIPMTKHTYGEWKVTKPATCTESGTMERECTECGDKETKETALAEHNYTDWHVTEASTCLSEGTRQRECQDCEYVQTETLKKSGHKCVWEVKTPATCTSDGTEVQKCTVCGEVFSERVIKGGHKPEADDHDCRTALKCEVCGETLVAAKFSHSYNMIYWESDSEGHWHKCLNPGCESKGSYKAHTPWSDKNCTTADRCSVCDAKLDNASADHSWAEEWSYDKYYHYKTCTNGDCGKSIKNASHTFNTDGDCTTAEECTVCGYVKTPAKASHSMFMYQTAEGHYRKCINKDCTEEEELVPHTDNGFGYCTECGYRMREDIGESTVSLNTTKYYYDGSAKTPAVTVKDGGKTLTEGKDYTLEYNNNVNAGIANVEVNGRNGYLGSVERNFTIEKKSNMIVAANYSRSYSASNQTFPLAAVQTGNTPMTYSSNNSGVTVNNAGTVTIKGGFAGTAKVTVTANENAGYKKAQTTVTVNVNKLNNTVTVPASFTKSYSAQNQSFASGATQAGDAKLTYKSNNSKVTVDANGMVTIKGGFAGTATVTVTAPATTGYNAASKTFTVKVNKINNSVTASNFTKNYSAKAQSFSMGATQAGDAKLTYKSNNSKVTVDANGMVTIKGGFAGTATVTVTAPATTGYNAASKTFTVKVNKINNSVTASNFTKNYSAKAQSFSIGAKQKGDAKLTYKSNNSSVTVSSAGKVTVKKGFIGKATVTITAPATTGYNKATKSITVTVNPPKASVSKLTNSASKKVTVKWAKNTAVTGYQIQYTTDKNFKSGVKSTTVKKNGTVSTTLSKLTKGKTYYVRIRTYKTVSGKTYYSDWSAAKSVNVKK